MKRFLFCTAAAVAACISGAASAALLTDGGLSVTIRDDNGAIDAITFGGSDYFNPGAPVSDYGFQEGSVSSTFRINDTNGSTGVPVTVTASLGSTAVTGSFLDVAFSRTYSLLPGLNTLRIMSRFTNLRTTGLVLSYFDTFDPDQGVDQGNDFRTFNDVVGLSGTAIEVGGLFVTASTTDARATVAAGSPFQIVSGFDLNEFFDFPFDGDGTFHDQGLHIGLRTELAAGSSTEFVYDLSFGPAVPEPSTLALLGLAVVGCGARVIRAGRPKQV